MRAINSLIVHCSATPDDRDITAADIRRWHKARGWRDIGYHFVIRRNGAIEFGRKLEIAGAHVKGHNSDSIGVCLIGDTKFNPEQFAALKELHGLLKRIYPDIEHYGHHDFTTLKTCPNFDVEDYLGPR